MYRTLHDPFTEKTYEYITRDAKEEQLYKALEMALEDQCPPDRKDYLCQASEDEDTSEANCRRCILRWATKQFGTEKNRR